MCHMHVDHTRETSQTFPCYSHQLFVFNHTEPNTWHYCKPLIPLMPLVGQYTPEQVWLGTMPRGCMAREADDMWHRLGLPGRQKTVLTLAEFYAPSPEPPKSDQQSSHSAGEEHSLVTLASHNCSLDNISLGSDCTSVRLCMNSAQNITVYKLRQLLWCNRLWDLPKLTCMHIA